MSEYLKTAEAVMRFIRTRKRTAEEGCYWTLEDAAAGRKIYYDEVCMYAGAAGIIQYALALYHVTGKEEYRTEAVDGADYLVYRFRTNRELKRNFSQYAFSSGWAGVAFTLAAVYEETKKEAYKQTIEAIVDALRADAKPKKEGYSWCTYPGIVGDAGTILVLLELAKRFDREDWKEFAVQAGQRYLGEGREAGAGKRVYLGVDPTYFGGEKDYIDPNYPMGTAGIGYLLLRLYEESGRQEFLDAVAGIPEYLRAAAVRQKYGHLLPHGLPKNPDLFYLGYCHGPAGTTRFLYKLYEITGKEEYKEQLRDLVKGLEDTGAPHVHSEGYWNTYNMCCGTAGILNMYLGLWAAFGEAHDIEEAVECGKEILAGADTTQSSDGDETSFCFALDRVAPDHTCTPIGLFDGAAGIGAALLQLHLAKEGDFQAVRMVDDPFPKTCLNV